MRISHSGKTTFTSCSEKYRLHYIEKLRGPKIYSSLFFGSALDEAFSRLLLDKKKLKTPEELELLKFSAEEVFMQNMEQTKHNDKIEKLSDNVLCDYYTSDYEESLLTKPLIEKLRDYAPDVKDIKKFMAEAKTAIKDKKRLTEEDYKLYNYTTWLTLVEKGLLMVDAYRTQVMPQINEVFSIQEGVELPNEDGDILNGKIDFTCDFVEEVGALYIVDNKTSSKAYKESEAANSEQLATYCEYKGTNKAAYIVVQKKVFAKAPKIRTQIIRDEVLEETFDRTFAQFEDVLYNISTGTFEKNFKSCFEYGRICPYFRLCKHNSKDGLINLKEEREKSQI